MNDYRDIDGFINLNLMDIRKEELAMSWQFNFLYEGRKYFYKSNPDLFKLYNELLAYYIAKDMHVPASRYDLARYNNCNGVISKYEYNKDDKYYSLEDLLKSRYGSKKAYEKNNLYDIWSMLETKDVNTSKLMTDIACKFMYDIMISNDDTHYNNLGFIDKNDDLRLCPIFDNEGLLSNVTHGRQYYCMGLDRGKNSEVLGEFLSTSDQIYRDYFIDNLWVISDEALNDDFLKIEEQTSRKLEDDYKEYIYDGFSQNRKYINYVLKNNNKVLVREKICV